jgi:hypothetical protein
VSRRPALFTQADVARAIRAAKQEGAAGIEMKPDGSILVRLVPESTTPKAKPIADKPEVVL